MKSQNVLNLKKCVHGWIERHFPKHEISEMPLDDFVLGLIQFSGTYLLYSDDKIIYVGQSTCIGKRILSHLNNRSINSFAQEITRVEVIRFDFVECALDLEILLIDSLRPKYNKANLALGYIREGNGFSSERVKEYKLMVSGLAHKIKGQQAEVKPGGTNQAGFHTRIHGETL